MSVAPIEYPTVNELITRRQKLLDEIGMSFAELIQGERSRSLNMAQYIILDRIRSIDFLLED